MATRIDVVQDQMAWAIHRNEDDRKEVWLGLQARLRVLGNTSVAHDCPDSPSAGISMDKPNSLMAADHYICGNNAATARRSPRSTGFASIKAKIFNS